MVVSVCVAGGTGHTCQSMEFHFTAAYQEKGENKTRLDTLSQQRQMLEDVAACLRMDRSTLHQRL